MQIDNTLVAESKEELNSLLKNVKGDSEKAGLKLKKQRSWHLFYHFMANRLGKSENSSRFYFLADMTIVMKLRDTCSLEEKL